MPKFVALTLSPEAPRGTTRICSVVALRKSEIQNSKCAPDCWTGWLPVASASCAAAVPINKSFLINERQLRVNYLSKADKLNFRLINDFFFFSDLFIELVSVFDSWWECGMEAWAYLEFVYQEKKRKFMKYPLNRIWIFLSDISLLI